MGRDLFRRKIVIHSLRTLRFCILFILAVALNGRADPGVEDPSPLPIRPEQGGRIGRSAGDQGVLGSASPERAAAEAPSPAVHHGLALRPDPADGAAGQSAPDSVAAEQAAITEQPAAASRAALHDRGGLPLLELGCPEHPAVEYWRERFLAGGTRALQETLERSRTFRRFIADRLDDRGMPQELIYLPVLESLYRVRAVSRSGATGLWQIMDNTAAPLGLVSDRWVDERRDFWKSTEGALRKLQENYATFGNWDLALAAYNCGSGCLSRTMSSSGVRDFWTLRDRGLLRQETAAYVPKFYALVSIFNDPTANGLRVSWEQAPTWQRIPVDRSLELALLAEMADLPLSLMEEAHAELRTPITPPFSGRPYYLKVPVGYGERVAALLADPGVQLLRYTFHSIRSGDTYYALAEYYGLSVALLMQANPTLSPRSLRIGSELRIPVFSGRPIKEQPIVSLSEDEAAAFTAVHTVETGDTLWGISRIYGTTVEILAWVNGRSLDAVLKPGETLKVPPPAQERIGDEAGQPAGQRMMSTRSPAQAEQGETR